MSTTLNINVHDEVALTVKERIVFAVKKVVKAAKNIFTKAVNFVSSNGNKAPPVGVKKGRKKKV